MSRWEHQPESSRYKTEPLVSGYVTPDILRPSVQLELELELELEVQVEKLSLKLIVAIKSCDHIIGNRRVPTLAALGPAAASRFTVTGKRDLNVQSFQVQLTRKPTGSWAVP